MELIVKKIKDNGVAQQIGLRKGDQIRSINGKNVYFVKDIKLRNNKLDHLEVSVLRELLDEDKKLYDVVDMSANNLWK